MMKRTFFNFPVVAVALILAALAQAQDLRDAHDVDPKNYVAGENTVDFVCRMRRRMGIRDHAAESSIKCDNYDFVSSDEAMDREGVMVRAPASLDPLADQ